MLNSEQLRPILEDKYNRENWYKILRQNFSVDVLRENPPPIVSVTGNEFNATAYELGDFDTTDGFKVGIYEVSVPGVKQIYRNKVGLRNLLRNVYKTDVDAALIVFTQGDKWRFSYVSEITTRNPDTGERETVKTDPKRYTYLFGRDEKAKTAADRFAIIQQEGIVANRGTTLKGLKDTFNVEKMSKEFFDKYREHYGKFLDYLIGENEDGDISGVPSAQFKTIFNSDGKKARDFVKKMLGRIVFLYFLEKKGWLGVSEHEEWGKGDADFLRNLFENSKDKEGFYPLVLEPLFHATLNQVRDKDFFAIDDNLFNGIKYSTRKIPFLNGGLFEPETYNTDFLIFQADLFRNLFAFFDQYNFTVHEDSPQEHTVAVDPEMLGHIFENLLEDNKDKGAFYTPKEIVHYMCQESLIEYLCTKCKAESDHELRVGIERFIKNHELEGISEHDETISQALCDVKICDPAIGSGAFPMGVLLEIFHAVETLYHEFDATKRIWGLEDGWNPAKVKLGIIEKSIYGVDIEPGAVDIARLRFWLSLVVDEVKPQPLPNLDYKIVNGNSLLSKFEEDVIDIDWEVNAGTEATKKLQQQIQENLKKLLAKQKQFFSYKGDKKKIQFEIRGLKIDVLISQLELDKYKYDQTTAKTGNLFGETAKEKIKSAETKIQVLGYHNTIKKLEVLKLHPEKSLKFFDWKLDFPEVLNPMLKENERFNSSTGFDIVIGNPPWGGGLDSDLDALKKMYPDSTSEHTDSFKIFIDLSLRLCNVSASSSLIIPNTILRQRRLKDVRALILKKQIIAIVDLGENIFETVIAPSCIILIKNKTVENSQLQYNDISRRPRNKKEELLKKLNRNSLINQNYFNSNQDKEFIKPVLSFFVPVIAFGNFDHFALKDVGLQCQRVNVGKEARTKSDLAQRIFINEKIGTEPIMYWKGRDFEKYSIKTNTGRYFRRDFKILIKPNEIVYFNETVYNTSPKLLIRQTSDKIIAAVDINNRWFDGSVIGLIPTKVSDYDILYILGLFNSSLFRWCYQEIVNEEGRVFAQVKLSKVKQLPIRIINFSDNYEQKIHSTITSIVSYITFIKTQFLTNPPSQSVSTYFEMVLDSVIYEAYFPEVLKEHNIEFIRILGDLPKLSDGLTNEEKLEICKKVFDNLNNSNRQIKVNLLYIKTIKQFKIIEGILDTNNR